MHGDEEFEELRRRVVVAVRRHCPFWMREQADDLVQNVLVKLLKKFKAGAGNPQFSAVYLARSAHSAVVDEIRRVCRRREEPLDVNGERATDKIPAERGDPHRSSTGVEIARGIFDCLSRLSRPRRLAVALYLNGCTVPEAASRLDWHLKRTEALVYRGLAELRRCLQGKGLNP